MLGVSLPKLSPTATPSRSRGARSRLARLASGWAALACVGLLAAGLRAGEASAPVDFNFEVRPLLSDRCFKCHGPDEKARKAKLRLDKPEEAFAVRDAQTGKRAIVPGHPERSEAWRRMAADDADERMPPLKSNLTLTPPEKELLRRWIAQGAEYRPHWSLLRIQPKAVPRIRSRAGFADPIDSFVLARLAREGLKPAPEATKETLIRRLSFDLTGLPPTLAQIDEFLADSGPLGYERLVDRLLASPGYGERRANEWLDLARFADTYGYQSDVERDLSPWRDWLIRAFNENLSYDRFITWQLAGDLLPSSRRPTGPWTDRDPVVATAFNRLHRQTNEGGSIEEEFRAEYVADRVQTFGTVFLGLTLECARCHDHKYDPITQKDFYRVAAFFNHLDESGLYSHFTTATPSPTLLLWPDGAEARYLALRGQITAREPALSRLAKAARPAFARWARSRNGPLPAPEPVALFDFEEVKDNATPDRKHPKQPASLVDGPTPVEGKRGRALQFSGDNALVCKGAGAFNRTMPFSFALWLRPGEAQERAVVFHRSRAWTDSGSRGYELVLEHGHPTFALIHFWPGNALQVRAKPTLATNQWTHVTITYDGSSRAAGLRLYLNGQPAELEVVRDHLFKDILHRGEWGDADVGNIELTLAGRFRDSGFKNGAIDEFQVFDRRLTALEAEALAGSESPSPQPTALLEWYLQRVDPAYATALAELRRLREQENALINDVKELMVTKEMTPRRPTFVLKRGMYSTPGERVEPGVPERVLPFPAGLPRDRLGLAKWLVDPRHPLAARVVVNRVWQTHFGRGLAATAEDLGSQGQLPTHPELLDWLADWFIHHGWDLKALHRLVVTSAAYRQSSQAGPELLARDPENRLLARGPKHRLQAEQIRDNALAVSGLLCRQIGGPSVRPYQPAGLWEEAGTGKSYVPDKGDKLYRRSLYTFWRRTAPPPTMLAFDAPSREVCRARRETTATPLQSLVLLDDPQFVEAARVLGERLVREYSGDPDSRLVAAFRLTTGRRPAEREQAVLRRLYQEQLELYTQDEAGARKLLQVGERPADGQLPAPQVAATTMLVSTLMNLDEFVTKR